MSDDEKNPFVSIILGAIGLFMATGGLKIIGEHTIWIAAHLSENPEKFMATAGIAEQAASGFVTIVAIVVGLIGTLIILVALMAIGDKMRDIPSEVLSTKIGDWLVVIGFLSEERRMELTQ